MDTLYSIVNTDGKLLYLSYDKINIAGNEIAIEELLLEYFENPYFDFETRTFYNKE